MGPSRPALRALTLLACLRGHGALRKRVGERAGGAARWIMPLPLDAHRRGPSPGTPVQQQPPLVEAPPARSLDGIEPFSVRVPGCARASRLSGNVTVREARAFDAHGDLWETSTVETEDCTLLLVNTESTGVRGAVQDLVRASHPVLVGAYHRETTGQQPTEDECEALLFEAQLAGHLHLRIRRGTSIASPKALAGTFLEHARMLVVVFGLAERAKRCAVKWCAAAFSRKGLPLQLREA